MSWLEENVKCKCGETRYYTYHVHTGEQHSYCRSCGYGFDYIPIFKKNGKQVLTHKIYDLSKLYVITYISNELSKKESLKDVLDTLNKKNITKLMRSFLKTNYYNFINNSTEKKQLVFENNGLFIAISEKFIVHQKNNTMECLYKKYKSKKYGGYGAAYIMEESNYYKSIPLKKFTPQKTMNYYKKQIDKYGGYITELIDGTIKTTYGTFLSDDVEEERKVI